MYRLFSHTRIGPLIGEFVPPRLVADLPVASIVRSLSSNESVYGPLMDRIEHGYRLGRFKESKTYINNHLKFEFLFWKTAR